MAPGLANARPRAAQNLQMPHFRDWQGGQMPRSSPGAEGCWTQLELTDALIVQTVSFDGFDMKTLELEQAKESINLRVFVLYGKYLLFSLFFPV